jgi:hypothetical protein
MPGLITSPLGGPQAVNSIRRAAKRSSWRAVFVPLLIAIGAVSAACSLNLNHEEVELTFDNRTESLLCYFPSREEASAARCLQELRPLAQTAWRPGCGYGEHADELPLTVILTVKEGGHQIYQRTEECRMWQASDRKFVIEQRGDDFVVTDPLADTRPSP